MSASQQARDGTQERARRWRLIVGYKYMDVDYEEGEAGVLSREVYKMKHSGLNAKQKAYLEILDSNLNEII